MYSEAEQEPQARNCAWRREPVKLRNPPPSKRPRFAATASNPVSDEPKTKVTERVVNPIIVCGINGVRGINERFEQFAFPSTVHDA
ncbi:hypothetical protein VTH06DRAFT_4279 [Thermothelomyces fergusii]